MAQSNSIILDIQINKEALEQARQKAAELKAQIDGLRASMEEMANSGNTYNTQINQMAVKMTQLNQQYNSQMKVIQQVNVVQNVMVGSINNINNEITKVTQNTNNYTNQVNTNITAINNLNQANINVAQSTTKAGQAAQTSKGFWDKWQEGITNLQGKLSKLEGAMGSLPKPIRGVAQGIIASTKASLGFIATPLGATIAAISTVLQPLIAFLTKTEKGMAIVNTVSTYFSSTTKILTDKLAVLGEIMYNAFSNPKQAIKDLADFLVNNLINRIKGLIDLVVSVGKGFKALASGDLKGLKEAAGEAGTALIQMNTGLDAEQQQKFADAVRGTVKEIDALAQATFKLQDAQKQLEKAENAAILTNRQHQIEIDNLKEVFNDQKRSIDERADALKKASKLEQELLQGELDRAKQRQEVLAQQIALGEAGEDSERKKIELQAEILGLEEQIRDQKKQGEAEVTAFLQGEYEKQAQLAREKAEKEKAIEEEYAAIRQQFKDSQKGEYEQKIAELDAYVAKLREAKEEETAITAHYEKKKAEIEKAERERKYAEEEEARMQAHENELTALQLQFENKKLTEEEYKAAVLEANQEFLENSIALIQETLGNPEATTINDAIAPNLTDEEIQERLDKLAELHSQLNASEQQFAEEQKRISEEKKKTDEQITDARLSTAHSYVDAIGDLLGEQAKSNKAYKTLQKTLAIADIGVNLAKELGQINANPAVNADVTQTLRATLIGAAVARSIVSINKVRKMETGGKINTGNELPGFPRGGDNTLILAQPGELILNQRQQSNLGLTPHVLKSAGVPGFATGGFVDGGLSARALTTPVQQAFQEIRETIVPVLVLEDFETKQGTKVKVEDALSI